MKKPYPKPVCGKLKRLYKEALYANSSKAWTKFAEYDIRVSLKYYRNSFFYATCADCANLKRKFKMSST